MPRKVGGMVRIGWVPYCLNKRLAVRGFWPAWFNQYKSHLKKHLAMSAVDFRFKLVPVFARVPKVPK